MNFTASPLMVLFSSTFAFFKRKRLSSAKEREIKNKVKNKIFQDLFNTTSLFHPLQAWYERGGLENEYGFIKIIFQDNDLSKEILSGFLSIILALDWMAGKRYMIVHLGNNSYLQNDPDESEDIDNLCRNPYLSLNRLAHSVNAMEQKEFRILSPSLWPL